MTTAFKIPQTPQVALYSSIGGTDTSIRLIPSPKDLDGNVLTMDAFGTYGTGTIDPKVAGSEEIVGFTNLIDNGDDTSTITGVTRDLQSVYPYTGTGVGKTHGSSATFVFGINPQTLSQFPSKNNDETINGQWLFPTPMSAQAAANKAYVDGVAFGVSGSASTNSFGLVKLTAAPGTVLATPTITIASPAVVTSATHGLILGDMVKFSTTGALPTGITAGVTYFVISAGLGTNTFEISATPGGTAINTTGSQSGVHTLTKVSPYAVSDTDPRLPTQGENDALAGVLGTPSSSNKVWLQESATQAAIDQSQTTQNAVVEFGMANTTGLKNKISQSFIPLRTKLLGIRLYKTADSGSFTGTVTVQLYGDTSGSPGAALNSVTITNAQWLAIPVGEFIANLSAEQTGMTPGSLYWIVVTASTSDSSNHPNLGTNSAGGYANGSAKYNNTTDGWVAIASIDLYFKTIEGITSQLVETDSSGFVPLAVLGNRGGIYVTHGNGTPPANGATMVITHNMGQIPKYLKMKAYGVQSTASTSFNIESYGVATFDASGAATYHLANMSDVGAGTTWFETPGSASDKILNLDSGNSAGDLTATIGSVTPNALTLTFALGATAPISSWAYVIEVYY